MNVSERRVSLSGIQSAALKFFTSPAMRGGSREWSNRVMGPTPLAPFSRLSQASAAPLPTGDTMPRPVTTTLRFDMFGGASPDQPARMGNIPGRLLLDVTRDVIDGLLHVGNLF